MIAIFQGLSIIMTMQIGNTVLWNHFKDLTLINSQILLTYIYICIYIYIYIYMHIYIIFMLSTLSSKLLDAMNGAVIYIWGISITTNSHYTVFHGLNPIFRWLYDAIFICSKNKNIWKSTTVRNKFQTWKLNTSNLICLTLCSMNFLIITEWTHYSSNSLNAVT